MPNIKLPDGKSLNFKDKVTGFQIAEKISKSLSKQALIISVDGNLKDLNYEIYHDCSVKIYTAKELEDTEDPQYNMFLVVRDSPNLEGDAFPAPDNVNCAMFGVLGTQDLKNKTEAMAAKLVEMTPQGSKTPLPPAQAENRDLWLQAFGPNKYTLWGVTTEDLGVQVPTLALPEKVASKLKLWYDVDGSMGTLKKGPGQFFLTGAKIPKKDKKNVWKGQIDYGVSVNAADIGLDNKIFQKFAASAADEGSPYSFQNQKLMATALANKISNASWTASASATSQSVTVLLGKNTSNIDLPSFEDGLESLSIQNSNGKLEIQITVGNSLERQAIRDGGPS